MSAKAAKATPPKRRSRGSLSEEEILDGAIFLVKRDGLAGLSMPNLAKHLGAGVMSLYWYFHSKDELLGAMAEHAMKEVYSRLPPVGRRPWEDEVIRIMTALRAELRRTPLFAQLAGSRPGLLFSRPSAMSMLAGRIDQELQVVQRLGLDASQAMRMHKILSAYTLGFVLMQLGGEPNGTEPTPEQALEEAVAQLDPTEFPNLRSVSNVGDLVSLGDYDFDAFLRLLVSGAQSEYRSTAAPDGKKASSRTSRAKSG
jgi:AcrR family transcriptional regulator